MVTAGQVVQDLRDAGVRVDLRGSAIRTVGPVEEALAVQIREHRDEILELLKAEERLCGARWCTVRSRVLGETFRLVMNERDLEDAKAARPGMVVYSLKESLDLVDRGASDVMLRTIHGIKRRFGGRVIPDWRGGSLPVP